MYAIRIIVYNKPGILLKLFITFLGIKRKLYTCFFKRPFKNDVIAKMTFLDPPPPSLSPFVFFFFFTPLPPISSLKK